MAKVAINGFGRIGRATLKLVLDTPELEPVAINDLMPAEDMAYLLKYDTVYGRYDHDVSADGEKLVVDGKSIHSLTEKDPAQLPWSDLGVEIAFECTGIFRRREDLEKHVQAGAKHVILSAPARSEDVATIVHGVSDPGGGHQIMSCASCTTNSITPVVEVMGRRIGIKKATVLTVHAYTASQNLVDGYQKDKREGRAAAANLVPTSTGAAIATTQALPQYQGKFDGVAVRAPVPAGSIADIVFLTERETTAEEVNDIFREEAESDRYRGVMGVSEDELVSSDIVQDSRASIVDLPMTQVVDGDLVRVMSWYDNEWGYAAQLAREATQLAKSL